MCQWLIWYVIYYVSDIDRTFYVNYFREFLHYILDRIRRARNHLYLSATPMDELRIDQRAYVLYGPSAVSI